jgi:hypothetical protein
MSTKRRHDLSGYFPPEKSVPAFSSAALVTLLGPVLTTIGLIIGVWQFTSGQKANESIEFRRKMWEKRMDLYSSLGNVVGEIVINQNNPKKSDSLYNEFQKFYYAKLPLLEDSTVSIPLRRLKNALDDQREGMQDLLVVEPIKARVIELMDSCQVSLKKTEKQIDKP